MICQGLFLRDDEMGRYMLYGRLERVTIGESTPQVHVTTQQIHVTTETIDPNTLNQYCVAQWGYRDTNDSSDPNLRFEQASGYIQCAPTPLPGQGRYQP